MWPPGNVRGNLANMSGHHRNDEDTATVEGATRYMADLSRMCTGRAFFRTKQQRIGLGPRERNLLHEERGPFLSFSDRINLLDNRDMGLHFI
jgi:hypothetical protein